MRCLILKGVRQNNLNNIDLELPLGQAIVITGPSGSGKSSLAFDTIYAEGQRRYMQSISTYARQFMEKFKAPDADQIRNLPPTIALEQLNPVRNSRATVGTTTEIYDYLRLLFYKIGVRYCAKCNLPMKALTFEDIFERLVADHAGKAAVVCFERVAVADSGVSEVFRNCLRSGYIRVLFEGKILNIEEILGDKNVQADRVHVVFDRIRIPQASRKESDRTRITESLRTACELGIGLIFVENASVFSTKIEVNREECCSRCGEKSTPKSALTFSFNSPLGACPRCKGFGNLIDVDAELLVPNPNLSLAQGAVDPFTKPSLMRWQRKLLQFCATACIDADIPYRELPAEHKKLILEGNRHFRGVKGVFKLLEKKKYKVQVRVFLSRYSSSFLCTSCKGARLNPSSLRVKVGDLNISEVCHLALGECLEFIRALIFTPMERDIVGEILRQITQRLENLVNVGLDYLTLSRLSRSLSGGEYQRILLGTQLSQGLVDTLYVLDEPSIGLHPKDTRQLLGVLDRLLELGNSLVVVEHDPDIIQWGRYIVDLGPGSGRHGGTVVFAGPGDQFLRSESVTSVGVRLWKQECQKALSRPSSEELAHWMEIRGACGNNLRHIDVKIPLGSLAVVTGVSGSGKSTLIVDTLYQALSKIFNGRSEPIAKFESISGFDHLHSVQLVDQSPIGKSSRSNPITFIKAYDEIRGLFASTPDAVAKGLTPGHFSFNVKGGRCDACEGEGRLCIEMVFMEDIWVPCDACNEKRFKPHILAIRHNGKNIDDCLRMTVDEAHEFFKEIHRLQTKLALLHEVGLGYLQLGQPGYTLSGGESQRLKIARELMAGAGLERPATLFILDEPTTGLHFDEITKLIGVFRKLIRSGHSVVVIEHNLQVICAADHVTDLGPDGGDNGGRLVAQGPPCLLASQKTPHTGLYLSRLLS